MKKLIQTIFTFIIIGSLSSCYYDVQEELHPASSQACDTSQALYSVQIKSIMQNNCNSCHSTGIASGGIVTDNYQELKRIADNGTLIGSINHKAGFRAMPQNMPKMVSCNLQLIEKWVREGSQNN